MQTVGSKLGLSASSIAEYGVKFGGQLSEGLGDKDVLRSGWLDPQLSLQQHGVKSSTRLELKWMKRFFVSDHCVSTTDEVALHYSFLECRNVFLTDVLDTSSFGVNDVAQCAACLLHVDHGRFDKKKHTQQWYAGKRYVPESWTEMCGFSATAAAWKQLGDDAAPKKTFVDLCRKFPGFACTFFDNVTVDGRDSQVAVSMERVVVYGRVKAATANQQRRLSRAALALSPRGGGAASPSAGGVEDGEASPGRRLGLSRSSSSSSTRRGSVLQNSREDVEESDGEGVGASPQQVSSVASSSPVVEAKSPRGVGLLSRTFTLRRDKKSSSPNLLSSQSSDNLGGSVADRSKSGRFKSFAGLRDLALKRGNTKTELETSSSSVSSPVQDASPVLARRDDRADEGTSGENDSQQEKSYDSVEQGGGGSGGMEGRKERWGAPLEDLARWGVRGCFVVVETAGPDVAAGVLVELRFATSEAAGEFCELLRGYCALRLEEAPSAGASGVAERGWRWWWSAGGGGAGALLCEVTGRARNRMEGPAESERARVVQAASALLRAAAGAGNVSGQAAAGLTKAAASSAASALPGELEAARAACEALAAAASVGWPGEAEDEGEGGEAVSQTLLRERVLAALARGSALANALLRASGVANQATAAALERALDESLLLPLDEAGRRPGQAEPIARLARLVLLAAPRLADLARQALSSPAAHEPTPAGRALRSCGRLFRAALGEAVVAATGEATSSGAGGDLEGAWRAASENEASLRRVRSGLFVAAALRKSSVAVLRCAVVLSRASSPAQATAQSAPLSSAASALLSLEPARRPPLVDKGPDLLWLIADVMGCAARFFVDMYGERLIIFFVFYDAGTGILEARIVCTLRD
jgi:hypothetical protein